jgi:hypothetical protein
MGLHKAKEPMFPKEIVGPALMIVSPANPFEARTPTQNTPKAAAHPLIHGGKGPFMAVLEILKPAAKDTVDVCDDDRQAVAVAAGSLGPEGVFDFPQALLAGPASAPSK